MKTRTVCPDGMRTTASYPPSSNTLKKGTTSFTKHVCTEGMTVMLTGQREKDRTGLTHGKRYDMKLMHDGVRREHCEMVRSDPSQQRGK